jgi:uncharacterized protein (DUF58 family)
VELLAPEARSLESSSRFIYVRRIEPGLERLATWEETLPERGRHRLTGVRLTTRFPFGLFVKAGRPALTDDVVVFPAVRDLGGRPRLSGGRLRPPARPRRRPLQLRAAVSDIALHPLAQQRQTDSLLVREARRTENTTRLVLVGRGRREALERGGLSEAASLAVALVRAGAGWSWRARAARCPSAGRAHLGVRALALPVTAPRAAPAALTGARRGGAALAVRIALA